MSFATYVFIGAVLTIAIICALSLFVRAGLKPAKKTRINDSVPHNSKNAVKVYEQDSTTGEWFSTLIENQTSPAFLEYLDRLKGNHIEHFIVPVKYNPASQKWESTLQPNFDKFK